MEIDARLYSELTEDERREIEIEENIRRKDLTPYERSKNLVALAETAAKVLDELPSTADEKSKRGRPEKKVSDDKVAERTGVPRPTIHNAKAHVAAIERYPELAAPFIPQKDAITFIKVKAANPPYIRRSSHKTRWRL